MARRTFSAGIASRVSGVPYRTLDYWARSRFIVPSGREASGTGSERQYTFDDLIVLRTAHELRAGGISLRSVVRFLRKNGPQKPLSEMRLVIRGKDVLAVNSNKELLSTLQSPGQYAFSFFLDVGQVVRELEQGIQALQAA